MELKPGYKQTEVGVIPEDWEVNTLDSRTPFVTSGSRGWAKYYSDSGAAFLRIGNLSRDSIYINLKNLTHVSLPTESSEGLRTRLQYGDILISITADIGMVCFADNTIPNPSYINQHLSLVRFRHESVCSHYLSYYLSSERTQRYFRATTDQGAKAGLNLSTVRKIRAVYPPYAEQRAIATALSDVDDLLAKLDQLLAKKRDIKQAAMQELLTGKRRLPGFSGEWRTTCLGELGPFLKGRGVRKDEASTGDRACIRYGELYTHHQDQIRAIYAWISSEVAATATRLRTGDILFAGSGETKEEIGKCATFTGNFEAYAGGDIIILRPYSAHSVFLGYHLNSHGISTQKASKGQGDAVVHISSSALASIEITIPSLPEQAAIAAVLSDMDAEIAELETRREKNRALKQGMMQELLTGRIRLVPPAHAGGHA